jgi:hypothetical protein
MAVSSFFPGLKKQAEENAVPIHPHEQNPTTEVSQFGNVSAVPEAVAQAPEQLKRASLADFEPPPSVMAGFGLHIEKEKG